MFAKNGSKLIDGLVLELVVNSFKSMYCCVIVINNFPLKVYNNLILKGFVSKYR